MICYRGKTFCADQDVCRVQQCKDRLTEAEREMALDSGLPVAWAHFGQLCSRFSPSAPDAKSEPTAPLLAQVGSTDGLFPL